MSSSERRTSNPNHPPLPPNANAFIGPGNTSLGAGPVIPNSMPSANIKRTSVDDAQPQRKQSQGTAGTGSRATHEDGRARLGSDADDFAFTEKEQSNKTGQDGASNPWRGPGGMKLGHGPRVDHLEKNEDGSFKLNQSQGYQPDSGASGGQEQ
ncbi:MAG: hypothetical protein Q9162_001424 [Coniocarpon cinnabarinum]